jgi:uncharacterized protein (DUF2336 family)
MNDGAAAPDALAYAADKAAVASGVVGDRRRVASRRDAKPELLYFLASDAAPEVRREVARNAATPWQADELLVRDRDDDVRCDLGAKLARLLPGMSGAAREGLRARVMALIETLARDEAERVRASLATAIKELDCVPRAVVTGLAADDALVVAEPVLRFSPLLGEAELLEIIAGRHAAGALGAIAARAGVSAAVSDAIVKTDDADAVATLLANPSAQVREETLDALVDRAPDRPTWHGPLVDRPGLPGRFVRRLAAFVADSFLARLEARPDLDASTRAALTQAVKERAPAASTAAPEVRQEPAEDRVRRLLRDGNLDEEALWAALEQGDRPFLRSALALLCGISNELVDRIIGARSAKAMVALAWKAQLGPRLGYQLQLRLAGLSPRQALGPKNGGWPLTPDEMTWHLEFFGA